MSRTEIDFHRWDREARQAHQGALTSIKKITAADTEFQHARGNVETSLTEKADRAVQVVVRDFERRMTRLAADTEDACDAEADRLKAEAEAAAVAFVDTLRKRLAFARDRHTFKWQLTEFVRTLTDPRPNMMGQPRDERTAGDLILQVEAFIAQCRRADAATTPTPVQRRPAVEPDYASL